MTIKLPTQVERIFSIFKNNGFEAYVVGGCVRDTLLGVEPKDWDICTNALPAQTLECFKGFKTIETGLKHGTVTVIIDGMPIEITTYRIDGEYTDNRRPDKVTFTRNIQDDLSRRDFTINAMAYNHENGLIDYYGGQHDLNNKLVKCVGNPVHRFNEDAVRIMRALRFASVLGFDIDDVTGTYIIIEHELLRSISVERISTELNKLLLGKNVGTILYRYRHIIATVIPELTATFDFEQNNPYHIYDVFNHTIDSISQAKIDLPIRLAMLFHDIAKPDCYTADDNGIGHFYGHAKESSETAVKVLKRLKYETAIVDNVRDLIFYHDIEIAHNPRGIKRLLNKIGPSTFFQLILVKEADIAAQNPEYLDRMIDLEDAMEMAYKIVTELQCFSVKDLKINGLDLINLGFIQGKIIGTTLHQLVELVIDDVVENKRDELLIKAKDILSKLV